MNLMKILGQKNEYDVAFFLAKFNRVPLFVTLLTFSYIFLLAKYDSNFTAVFPN